MQTTKPFSITSNEWQSADDNVRPWGRWRVLDEGAGYKVKMLEVLPGQRLSLQYHRYRSEHWVVAAGRAKVVCGEKTLELGRMQSLMIPKETVHRIENPYKEILLIVELQQGDQLLEQDIVRLEDDYNRQDLQQGVRL